jgi:hypothetical protein
MSNTAAVTGDMLIAVLLQSISDVSAINPLVAFYAIHGGKREVLFFFLSRTPHETTTTRETSYLYLIAYTITVYHCPLPFTVFISLSLLL